MYDKDLYLEDGCVNGAVPLPVNCNYMGLGQACRGCFTTCAGAQKYMEDFPDEIGVWVNCLFLFVCSRDVLQGGAHACCSANFNLQQTSTPKESDKGIGCHLPPRLQ